MAPVLCFITVDTEEDEWGAFEVKEGSVSNIDALPEFQALCEGFGAVPTYLANWPVVQSDRSRAILRDLQSGGRCEIGTHCHPWNTPPIEEQVGPEASWMGNLNHALVEAKLTRLHGLIEDRLEVSPRTFRTGRWGFGPAVARALFNLGYRVDSSVSPFIDWTRDGGPDYSSVGLEVYRFDPDLPFTSQADGALLQVPATVGFYQRDQRRAGTQNRIVRQKVHPALRLTGILDHLGMLNLRWLSPEQSNAQEMIRLARTLLGAGYQWLNIPLHSVTLLPGATPFVRTGADRTRFLDTLRQFLEFARDAGVQFAPLSAATQITPPGYATP